MTLRDGMEREVGGRFRMGKNNLKKKKNNCFTILVSAYTSS